MLFFVSVGMLFDPMILVQQPLAVLGTLAIIIFGKSVAAFSGANVRPLAAYRSYHRRQPAQIGEFAFILAGLGMALNRCRRPGRTSVLAGAILDYAEPRAVRAAGKISR